MSLRGFATVKARQMTTLALEAATRKASRKHLVWAYRLEGEIARARKESNDAERYFGQALKLAQAIGNPPQLWKTHQAL